MKTIVLLLSCVGIAGFLADASVAADAPLEIGDRAPEVELSDQNGKKVTLDDLLMKGSVALVFYRSASW